MHTQLHIKFNMNETSFKVRMRYINTQLKFHIAINNISLLVANDTAQHYSQMNTLYINEDNDIFIYFTTHLIHSYKKGIIILYRSVCVCVCVCVCVNYMYINVHISIICTFICECVYVSVVCVIIICT